MHPEQTRACSKQSTVTFSRRKHGVGGCGVRFPVRKDSFPLLAIVPVISPPGMLLPDLLSDSHEESAQILLFPETFADPLQKAVIAPLVNTWTTRCGCYFTFCIFPLILLFFSSYLFLVHLEVEGNTLGFLKTCSILNHMAHIKKIIRNLGKCI